MLVEGLIVFVLAAAKNTMEALADDFTDDSNEDSHRRSKEPNEVEKIEQRRCHLSMSTRNGHLNF